MILGDVRPHEPASLDTSLVLYDIEEEEMIAEIIENDKQQIEDDIKLPPHFNVFENIITKVDPMEDKQPDTNTALPCRENRDSKGIMKLK